MILADEPTGNLDRRSGLEALAVFKRLHGEGRTILLVTHDLAVAEHADRVLVLKDGRIAEDRKVERPHNAEAEIAALAGKEVDRITSYNVCYTKLLRHHEESSQLVGGQRTGSLGGNAYDLH